ncbi:MAG: esterase family protein [Gammaproteobacteria bacterium]|nr:esterase family protein [Gammaproteobacteria bacterium]
MPAASEIVTKSFDYDGNRQVSVYVPRRPAEVIVYCGDGQLITQWGEDLEEVDVPSTMIVGTHRIDDETIRLHEYSPKFDPEKFAAHEDFFIHDVSTWIDSEFGLNLPSEKTAVFGVSASGEFALAMGVRHPDRFGAVFSASPGAGYRPPEKLPTPMPRTYLVAGIQEPFFLENAMRWVSALRDSGDEVLMRERDAGHDDSMWRKEFPLMIAWAFA